MITAAFAISCSGKSDANKKSIKTSKKETIMKTIPLTKEEFLLKVDDFETNPNEWKYLGDKPCVIDFFATWCGPCKRLGPILEELAEEYDGKIVIYKVDIDQQEELAQYFGIQSVPTMFLCPKDGQPQIAQGALPKAELKRAIKEVLKVE